MLWSLLLQIKDIAMKHHQNKMFPFPVKEFGSYHNRESNPGKSNTNLYSQLNFYNSGLLYSNSMMSFKDTIEFIDSSTAKANLIPKTLIQGGRFLDHDNLFDQNQNHRNRELNFCDHKRNRSNGNAFSKTKLFKQKEDFTDLNDFSSRNLNAQVKKLYCSEPRIRFKSKRVIKYKFLGMLNQNDDKESNLSSSYCDTVNDS